MIVLMSIFMLIFHYEGIEASFALRLCHNAHYSLR